MSLGGSAGDVMSRAYLKLALAAAEGEQLPQALSPMRKAVTSAKSLPMALEIFKALAPLVARAERLVEILDRWPRTFPPPSGDPYRVEAKALKELQAAAFTRALELARSPKECLLAADEAMLLGRFGLAERADDRAAALAN